VEGVKEPYRFTCVTQFLEILQNFRVGDTDGLIEFLPLGLHRGSMPHFLDQLLFLLAKVFLLLSTLLIGK